MAEISLIPKKLKEKALPRFSSFRGPKIKFNKWLKVGVIALIAVIILGAGLFIWKGSLSREQANLQEDFKNTVLNRDASLESELAGLDVLITSFEDIFKKQSKWSRLFGVIEDETVQSVVFTTFSGNSEKGNFLLGGLSPNFNALAQQTKALEENNDINKVEVSNISVNKEGLVSFQLDVTFNNKLLTKPLES